MDYRRAAEMFFWLVAAIMLPLAFMSEVGSIEISHKDFVDFGWKALIFCILCSALSSLSVLYAPPAWKYSKYSLAQVTSEITISEYTWAEEGTRCQVQSPSMRFS